MSRLYGRKLGGERLEEIALKRKTGKLSLIAAVSSQGLDKERCLILEDNVDGNAFLAYIEHVLAPTLKKGQVVIMDNYSVHHNDKVQAFIEAKGAEILFLPTYSPDFNPIELLFAKIKAFIRKCCPKSIPKLFEAFSDAVLSVTKDDAKNAFAHCGYVSE